MTTKNYELSYLVDIIAELYEHPFIKNFVPTLNRGRGRGRGSGMNSNNSEKIKHAAEVDSFLSMWIPQELTSVGTKEPLDHLLKTTILSNIPTEKKITQNGIERDELNKGIAILRARINTLIANNNNGNNNEELSKYQRYLGILETKYTQCLQNGNFEQEKNFRDVAIKALQILNKNNEESKNLYKAVNKKLGIEPKVIYDNRRDAWMAKWKNYEENEKDFVILSEREKQEYEDYKRQKNRYHYDQHKRQEYQPAFKSFVKNDGNEKKYIPTYAKEKNN